MGERRWAASVILSGSDVSFPPNASTRRNLGRGRGVDQPGRRWGGRLLGGLYREISFGIATAVLLRSEVRRSRTERRRISIPRQTPRLTVQRDSSLPLVAQNDRREVDAAAFRA